ncbi:unnamed protein product [Adineta ricciae]|uniref:Uncharacterized protein n=1 Tax=Adineta ricciae TaxID=249248 RepID=A0A813VS59_ADIRI|nr:unnamed protein product [Adineta ricciae]CAF1567366.1 unnamed protein product [Adineta ricciae]
MAQCFDTWTNQYVYCTSNRTAYIAVGVIVPALIFILIILIFLYRRYKLKKYQRDQQMYVMNTIVPIHNHDEQQQAPYSSTYPPTYTTVTENPYEKPPSYEQTVQEISEANRMANDPAAILPVTTMTSSAAVQTTNPSRN